MRAMAARVGESMRDPARYYRQNVGGGIALIEAARTAGVERVVFSSTAAVYGIPEVTPIPEDAPLRPINTYGETKRTFEGALGWYGKAYGLRSVSMRYFNVAGCAADGSLGEDHEPETHLVPVVLLTALVALVCTVYAVGYFREDERRGRIHANAVRHGPAHTQIHGLQFS